MSKWIKLIDEAPEQEGIYKCYRLGYPDDFYCEHLLWTKSDGFQPEDYDDPGNWAIDMDVTHWLKVDEPPIPKEEAEALKITVERFFASRKELFQVINYPLNIHEELNGGTAVEIITTGMRQDVLEVIRGAYKSAGIWNHVIGRKKL